MSFINKEDLLNIYKKWLPQLTLPEDAGDKRGVETCIIVLEDAPIIDAVEVVRCKYCRHGHYCCGYKKYECHHPLYPSFVYHKENHYCSYGERKNENC